MASRLQRRRFGRAVAQLPALDALHSAAFRRLWAVAMTGTLSMGAVFTALGWVVVEESGSPLLVSLVLVSFLAPQVIAGPIGGVLADRYGRAGLLRVGISGRAAVTCLMGLSLAVFPHALAPLFLLNALASIMSGATIPSRRALMADTVPPQGLTNAVALDEFAVTSMFVIGPLAAGALLVIVPPAGMFVAVAGVMLLGAILVPSVREQVTGAGDATRGAGPTERVSFVRSFVQGVGYIRRSRVLLGVTLLTFTAETLAFNYMSLAPIFASEVFHGGSRLLGAINGMMPVGELIGAAFMAVLAARIVRPARVVVLALLVTHAVAIPLGASSWLPGTFLLLVALGISANIFFVTASTTLLRETPPEARARVLGLQQMTWGAGALGGLTAGALGTAFTPHVGAVAPAAVGLVLVALIALVSPELWRGRHPAAAEAGVPD